MNKLKCLLDWRLQCANIVQSSSYMLCIFFMYTSSVYKPELISSLVTGKDASIILMWSFQIHLLILLEFLVKLFLCEYHRADDMLIFVQLSHWGRVTHTCIGNLTVIGSYNGLSPGWCRAIIWNNAGILLIGTWRTNFSEILIKILTFSLQMMYMKMLSVKWQPFCLSLNVLMVWCH